MARRTHVTLVDDVDGSAATSTVTFSLDGVSYEIDLSDENAEKMREEIGEWAAKARRVGGRKAAGHADSGLAEGGVYRRGIKCTGRSTGLWWW